VSTLLALVAAFCFALAATLQQKGALGVGGGVSFAHPKSLLRLGTQRTWLLGSGVLLVGYVFQAAALDRGRLSVVQPLLVTTIVFALPLGYYLTGQQVGRREIYGAVVVVAGLVAFTVVGDPAGGKANASGDEWAVATAIVVAISGLLLAYGGRGTLERKAGTYGAAAGLLYGLSASLCKPTVEMLNTDGIGGMLSAWEFWAFAAAGIGAFLIQQVSLGTGRLAPSVASTSVMNPIVSVLIGIVLLDETLSAPAWHKAVAWVGLGCALAGAVVISTAREGTGDRRRDPSAAPEAATAGG
jgi:drug/metabolite transporter (DMT)-like permease